MRIYNYKVPNGQIKKLFKDLGNLKLDPENDEIYDDPGLEYFDEELKKVIKISIAVGEECAFREHETVCDIECSEYDDSVYIFIYVPLKVYLKIAIGGFDLFKKIVKKADYRMNGPFRTDLKTDN